MIPPPRHLQSSLPTPTASSTSSFWLGNPSEKLLGHRTTSELPTTADIVVVGSGITGAFAAREILVPGQAGLDEDESEDEDKDEDGKEGRVVMLEAREACWGATGRNGGHCQPLLYLRPPSIGQFELETFHLLADLIRDNDIPCDWKNVGGVHPLLTEEAVSLVEGHLRSLRESHPHLAELCTLVKDRKQLEEELRLVMPGGGSSDSDENDVGEITAALVQKYAAKCWPYKLVSWVLEDLLSRFGEQEEQLGERHEEGESSWRRGKGKRTFNLQTNTPVLKLQRLGDEDNAPDNSASHRRLHRPHRWVVHTARGQILASKVLLATNGYTSYLLPDFSGVIVPVRGQVAALRPPEGYTPLQHSYDFLSGTSEDYLIHRDDGRLILGGERLSSASKEVGVSDDGTINEEISDALGEAMGRHVRLRLDGRRESRKLDAEKEWTGIMGYSSDGYPWVGEVTPAMGGDGKGGLWMAAGYTGHGMPVAARCGMAVAQKMLGRKGEERGEIKLPKEWETADREVGLSVDWMRSGGVEEHLRNIL